MTLSPEFADAVASNIRARIGELLGDSSQDLTSWDDMIADIAHDLAGEVMARMEAQLAELTAEVAADIAFDLAHGVYAHSSS